MQLANCWVFFRTESIYLLPIVVSCSSAFVGLRCITEYHKLKWQANYSCSLDFFCVILSALGLDFDFGGDHNSVRINGSSVMADSSALRIKL